MSEVCRRECRENHASHVRRVRNEGSRDDIGIGRPAFCSVLSRFLLDLAEQFGRVSCRAPRGDVKLTKPQGRQKPRVLAIELTQAPNSIPDQFGCVAVIAAFNLGLDVAFIDRRGVDVHI
jgi:hypothetical protein